MKYKLKRRVILTSRLSELIHKTFCLLSSMKFLILWAREFWNLLLTFSPTNETRKKTWKHLWNTKRPQPLPESKGYWLSRIYSCFGTSQLVTILAKFEKLMETNLAQTVKRHIYTHIWACNKASLTFCSKVLARTSSGLEKPLFWGILAKCGLVLKSSLYSHDRRTNKRTPQLFRPQLWGWGLTNKYLE